MHGSVAVIAMLTDCPAANLLAPLLAKSVTVPEESDAVQLKPAGWVSVPSVTEENPEGIVIVASPICWVPLEGSFSILTV